MHNSVFYLQCLISSTTHTCNPSTPEVEARKSDVQGHPWLYRELKTILRYSKCCLLKSFRCSINPKNWSFKPVSPTSKTSTEECDFYWVGNLTFKSRKARTKHLQGSYAGHSRDHLANELHFYQCQDSSAVWWSAATFPGNCAKVACVLDWLQNWENAVQQVPRAFRYPVSHELGYIWNTSALLFLMQSQRPLPNAQYTQSLPGSSGKGEGKLGSWHGIRLFVKSFIYFDKPSGLLGMTSPGHF